MARSYDISKQVVWQAYQRVKANKGSAGIDRMTVEMVSDYLKKHWPEIRKQVLSGTYIGRSQYCE